MTMKLNTSIVKNLYSNNLLNEQFFKTILLEKDLPHTLYKDCSVGFPWGEWDRTAQLIEEYADKLGFFDCFEFQKEKYQIFNFYYFFPKKAMLSIDVLLDELIKLNIHSFKVVISIETITCEIIKKIKNNLTLLNVFEQFQDKILYILLAARKFNTIDIKSELEIIKYLQDNKIVKEKSVSDLLKVRASSLLKETIGLQDNILASKLRCAVIVSGQFREPLRNIDALISKISECGLINIKEVFISSWKEVGGYNLAPEKFTRHLSSEVLEKIKMGEVSIEKIISMVEQRNSDLSTNNICTLGIPIRVLLNDEKTYPYNKMSNVEKMYFNNSLWIETLGKDYFKENFDIIIKVRPDIEIQQFEIHNSFNNTVYAEEGWIFRRWGFGMGDQILIGTTNSMCELLTCHNKEDIYNVVKFLYNAQEKYRGHVNLGIMAWSLGFDVERIENLKHIFKKPPVINEKFLESIKEQ